MWNGMAMPGRFTQTLQTLQTRTAIGLPIGWVVWGQAYIPYMEPMGFIPKNTSFIN